MNNNNHNRIKQFLKNYPQYKSRIDKLYFEFKGTSNTNSDEHYFNVYVKEYVYNDNVLNGVTVYLDNQPAEIVYILVPIIDIDNSVSIKYLIKIKGTKGLVKINNSELTFK